MGVRAFLYIYDQKSTAHQMIFFLEKFVSLARYTLVMRIEASNPSIEAPHELKSENLSEM